MKVVVAGGTGFLGRHMCRGLIEAGHEVTVLGRSPDKVGAIPQLIGANAAHGDVTEPVSLQGRLDGADACAYAVGFPNYPMENPRKGLTFDRYERGGVGNLLAEAERAGVERFFYLSGARVDPRSPKSWLRAKGLAEEAIKASGIPYSILRPSWVYGPEDKALNKFVTIARFSPIVPKPAPLGRPQRIQPVSYEDVKLAVRRIFEKDDAWGRVFEIGSREVMTMDQVIKTMLRVLGKKRLIVPVPAPLLKLATAPLGLLPAPPLNPLGVEFATQDGIVDISELERVLEVHPMSLEQGLSRYLGPTS